MVRAWYMDEDSSVDRRQPHMRDPAQFVGLDELKEHGIIYFKIISDDYDNNPELSKIREDRDYTYQDHITISRGKLAKYDEWLETFFTEHMHCDEEIRLFADGSGYFDIRDKEDKWIRIELVKGDMIILPAGIYHRFALDTNNYSDLKRYFVGVPIWTPFNRPGADEHESRKAYVAWLQAK